MTASSAEAQLGANPPPWVYPAWGETPTLAQQAAATATMKRPDYDTFVTLGCHFDGEGRLLDCRPAFYKATRENLAVAEKLVPYYRLHPDYVRRPEGDVVFVKIYLGPNPDPNYKPPQPPAPPIVAMPGPPVPPRHPVITKPEWIGKPTGSQVHKAYPKAALAAGQGGRVTLSCTVNADGTIRDCEVVSENPADLGFGAAALSLTPTFRMRSTTADGTSVGGARVRIPLSFTGCASPRRALRESRSNAQTSPWAALVDDPPSMTDGPGRR